MRHRLVDADAADVGRVLAGGLQRGGHLGQLHAGRVVEHLAGRSGVIGRAKRALIGSEWPVKTGTRTQVPDTSSSGMSRILRVSLRSFCSSSVSSRPSSTIEPARGSTLKAIGAGNTLGAGNSTAAPSKVQLGGPVDDLLGLLVELGDAGEPAAGDRLVGGDDQARSPASRCSGPSTGMAAMVVQFGLAMMPLGRSAAAWPLTSATTSGTSGSMRQADELSMTTAPAAADPGRELLARWPCRRRTARCRARRSPRSRRPRR